MNTIRKWRLLLAFWMGSLFFVSSNTLALGVGDAVVLTSLGQSLQVEVPLLSSDVSNLDEVKVTLASYEDFERVGALRTHALEQLHFSLRQRADSTAYIYISSDRPVDNPILDFLLEIVWPEGRMLKQYTLFLDPPVFDEPVQEKAKPLKKTPVATVEKGIVETLQELVTPAVEPPPVAPGVEKTEILTQEEIAELMALEPEPQPEESVVPVQPLNQQRPDENPDASLKPVQRPAPVPVVSEPPEPELQVEAPEAEPLSATEVAELMALEPPPEPVKAAKRIVEPKPPEETGLLHGLGRTHAGDSLWEIAKAARNDDSVTTQQVMMAILEANPQAFNRNNVNTLKAGVELKTPSAALVNSLTAAEAAEEMNRQWKEYSAYMEERRQKKRAAQEEKEKKAEAEKARQVQEEATDTRITGPRLRLVAPGTAGQGVEAEENIPGEGESGAGKEESSIAGGGDATGDEEETAGTVASDANVDENTDNVTKESLGLEQQTRDSGRALFLESEELSSFQGEVGAEDNFLQTLRNIFVNNAGYWVVLFLVVFMAAYLLFRRARKKKAEAFSFDHFKNELDDQNDESADAEVLYSESRGADAEEVSASVMPVDVDDLIKDIDALAEQKKWGQAITLLNEALYSSPHQLDIRMKLIEIYYKTANKDALIDQAKLYFMESEGGKAGDWDAVVEMGMQIAPEHRVFSSHIQQSRPAIVDLGDDDEENIDSVAEDLAKESADGILDEVLDSLDKDENASSSVNTSNGNGQTEQDLIFEMQQNLEKSSAEEAQLNFENPENSDENDYEAPDIRDDAEYDYESEEDLVFESLETKLDMARVYMDMGSKKEAHRLLRELLDDPEISEDLKGQASDMLEKVG